MSKKVPNSREYSTTPRFKDIRHKIKVSKLQKRKNEWRWACSCGVQMAEGVGSMRYKDAENEAYQHWLNEYQNGKGMDWGQEWKHEAVEEVGKDGDKSDTKSDETYN